MTRLRMDIGERTLVATLNVVVGDWVALDEVALSEAAWTTLKPEAGALASFRHPEPATSAGHCAPRCSVGGSTMRSASP